MNTVEFPGLGGLKLNVNQIALQLGNIKIYWYGIIIAVGFMLAIILSMRNSEKHGIKQEDFIDIILVAAPFGIIGARLYYVIFSWSNYRDDLTEIFKIWHGGLAIYGGIIAGILSAYVFAKVKKLDPIRMIDFTVPYIALAQSIGRWGNFVNQEAFGRNTTLPWGMTSETVRDTLYMLQVEGKDVTPDLPVHPTFLYESIWNILVFALLIFFRKKVLAAGGRFKGQVASLYMMLYGIGRFFIEGLRTDSLMLGNLRISQVLAIVFVIVFGILFIITSKRAENDEAGVEIGTSEYGAVLMNIKEEERKIFADTQNVPSDEEGQKDIKSTDGEKSEDLQDR